ncbi:protein jag [Lentilactobacillus senioris]|uniref:RNA-binding cell elongation regulator Jag/EloR n=1 Tax=Lentilactobacillus senioris TaxID=931534 RepID=UPI00227E0A3D|nr:RNA-binding cell elongation regulator Jag/EloR [Lentilactobacillus senioris]MCY9806131.1 protein jag [Lentilactobacillus senioris]
MTEFTGKNIEEAIDKGLITMGIPREKALITVKRSASNGFFGIGRQMALVDITIVEDKKDTETAVHSYRPPMRKNKIRPVDPATTIKKYPLKPKTQRLLADQVVNDLTDYLTDVIKAMGFELGITANVKNRHLISYELQTDNENRLIGRHGRTLNALQQLGQIYVNRKGANDVTVTLDVAGYRKRRQEILTKVAHKSAMEVIANGRPIHLNPMPAFERKIIHKALVTNKHVATYSSGKGNHRSIVIIPR